MSDEQLSVLSNQAVAACAVVYFLAFLAHLLEWAAARAPRTEVELVGAGVGPEVAPESGRTERVELFRRIGIGLTLLAVAIQFVAVVSRGLAADPARVPWGNMYEFTLTGSALVTVGYLVMLRLYRAFWLSPLVTGFVLVVLMIAVLTLYVPVVPLQDALQSPWLVIHVIAITIASAAFTLGAICSVLFLVKQRWGDGNGRGYLARVPDLDVLDRLSYRAHAFGFPLWTFAALIAGPIWAHYAWGRYWGWDPKEVWAFITWVVYAAYLHARATAGWKGRAAAVLALVGFATLLFNFIGINFFFGSGSQHSYAAPDQAVSVSSAFGGS